MKQILNIPKCRATSRFVTILLLVGQTCLAAVERKRFSTPNAYLIVEILDDDLVHFELSAIKPGPADTQPLYTSPMIQKTDYSGASSLADLGNALETAEMRIEVDLSNLNITVKDKARGNAVLTTFRPEQLNQGFKRLRFDRGAMQHVYGLGQQFKKLGSADGDWTTHGVREGKDQLGNGFVGFQRAQVGNVQIPVMYAVGANHLNYALLLDNVYHQRWDFTGPTWEAQMFGDQIRFYVMTGADLPDLRRDYLELTGTPPVPPRNAFGLWVSDFGYDNFEEIENLKNGLRADRFPVDGFVLDLNWFGGVVLGQPEKSHMGELKFDQKKNDGNSFFFGDPKGHIKSLNDDHVGLAVIEEAYLSEKSQTFRDMLPKLAVYQRTNGQPDPTQQVPIDTITGFWGKGRMIDWSDQEAGRFIHDKRRFPNLVQNGVTVHWTDLGEPENFDRNGCYEGIETASGRLKNEHSDIHNLYNLLWNKSIWDGYFDQSKKPDEVGKIHPRPFILTRSGAAGTQRYGAAMWSGDIASNLESLASHFNAQMHMSFSGIDFYGADTGGFRRELMPHNNDNGDYRGYQEELYTEWFANACWFDVPVRPHTDNQFRRVNPPYATAPDLVGKKASNLANLRQRYELIPYYYSLAYRAHLAGEPVVPPLVFYYQDDPAVRTIGHEKLIGRDLLVAVVARHGEFERDVYLPKGKWADYYSHEWVSSSGQPVRDVPTYREDLFRLPVFARAGAILPQMHVDADTLDSAGHRRAGAAERDELVVRVYADTGASSFTLYEDDGRTLNYDQATARPKYHHRETVLRQQQTAADTATVTIEKSADVGGTGAFEGAVNDRRNVIRLVVDNAEATGVDLNGSALPQQATPAAFETAASGWHNAGPNLIEAKSDVMNASTIAKGFVFHLKPTASITSVNFVCDRGFTTPGESIYVVGSIPELGNFDVTKAVKLSPNIFYEYITNPPSGNSGPGPSAPVWSGVISGLPPNTTFKWKCVRRREDGSGTPQFEPGPDNIFTTGASGYAGRALASF